MSALTFLKTLFGIRPAEQMKRIQEETARSGIERHKQVLDRWKSA